MFTIRPATRNDALHVAALVDLAGHGIEVEHWINSVDHDHSPLSAARQMIIADETLPYHLSKAHLLEIDGEVAAGLIGGLVASGTVIEAQFPGYYGPLLELESFVPGYWAVICVAVYPEFRGQGLARRLLDHAAAEARRLKAPGLSIVVEDSNTRALTLYRNWGFSDRETRAWLPYGGRSGPKNWVLLTLDL